MLGMGIRRCETYECNQGFLCRIIPDDDGARCVLGCRGGSNDGNEQLADAHANGTPEQQRSTTPLVNGVETRKRGANVDGGGDHGDDEGVRDTGVLEELSSVVENEVDTGQLLQRLKQTSGRQTLAHSSLEAIKV